MAGLFDTQQVEEFSKRPVGKAAKVVKAKKSYQYGEADISLRRKLLQLKGKKGVTEQDKQEVVELRKRYIQEKYPKMLKE